MRRAIIPALLLALVSVVLGATVFREQVAHAAQSISTTIVGPLDAQGNVRIHEQGKANVNVTNTPLPITVANDSLTAVPQEATGIRVGQLQADPGSSAEDTFALVHVANIDLNTSKTPATVRLKNDKTPVFAVDMQAGQNYFAPLTALLPVDTVVLDCPATEPLPCTVRYNLSGV